MVSFAERPGVDVYSQLPSSATSTSSAINRPLPHKPADKATAAYSGRKVLKASCGMCSLRRARMKGLGQHMQVGVVYVDMYNTVLMNAEHDIKHDSTQI